MPQMAPMNWLMLFILFILIFMLFNTMNYFSFMYNYDKNYQTKKSEIKKINWKW
uniref:ATP synthase complex subunit 8 n=1 Tax=Ochthebius deletus TaxID=2769892 RepID=A0A7H0DK83_9COLE|nr:ATP synthase F0 subunit 8 [Ochthebius deletus]QNP09743.1 ATP synthase F0 subunit 8 [Ochthebius deletus]